LMPPPITAMLIPSLSFLRSLPLLSHDP
jgi:hypothetical protein